MICQLHGFVRHAHSPRDIAECRYQACMVPGCVLLTHLMIDLEIGPTASAIATATELRITKLGTSRVSTFGFWLVSGRAYGWQFGLPRPPSRSIDPLPLSSCAREIICTTSIHCHLHITVNIDRCQPNPMGSTPVSRFSTYRFTASAHVSSASSSSSPAAPPPLWPLSTADGAGVPRPCLPCWYHRWSIGTGSSTCRPPR